MSTVSGKNIATAQLALSMQITQSVSTNLSTMVAKACSLPFSYYLTVNGKYFVTTL